MSSCLRRTYKLPKIYLISNKTSSVQYFSALSLKNHNVSSSNDKLKFFYKKVNQSNLTQNRNFSLDNVRNFYDSISSSEASKLFKEVFVGTHDFTGLPWSATILFASVILRLFVNLPCGVYQQYLVAKLELTKIELENLAKGSIKDNLLIKAKKEKWTKKQFQLEFLNEVNIQRRILIVKNNCHPFKSVILFFIQFPFWLLLSLTIRSLAVDSYKGSSDYPIAALQFRFGGPFWCNNLSLPDPTFILPTLNFVFLLLITEISLLSRIQQKISNTKANFLMNKIIPNFLRVFAVLFFFISAGSPSGVSLFWTSTSFLGLTQNLLLMSPKVKRFFKIPKTPSEYDKPYRQTWNNFLDKFRKLSTKKD